MVDLFVGPVDTQLAAVEVSSVQDVDGILSSSFVSELTESESLGATRLAVVHQSNVDDLSGLGEEVSEVVV